MTALCPCVIYCIASTVIHHGTRSNICSCVLCDIMYSEKRLVCISNPILSSMPIAVGPVFFKSTHQGSVRALGNISDLTMSHDRPHDISHKSSQLYGCVNHFCENCEMEMKHHEYAPMSVWLDTNCGFTPPFPRCPLCLRRTKGVQ